MEAIGEAHAALFQAALAVSGESDLGFNRRKVVDGRATLWWRNSDKQAGER